MKKYILGILLVATLVVVPLISSAAEDLTITPIYAWLSKGTSGSEPFLQNSIAVYVTANNSDVYLSKGAMGLTFVNDGGRDIPNYSYYVSKPPYPTLPVVKDQYGIEYYKLSKNARASFNSAANCNINQMFSGNYYGELVSIAYAKGLNTSTTTYYTLPIANIRTASTTYIVGEQGPWIKSASQIDGRIMVVGERLDKITKAYVGSSTVELMPKDAGTTYIVLPTTPRLAPGSYPVYMESVAGKSNKLDIPVGVFCIGNQKIGDVNGDGKVGSTDATLVQQIYAGLINSPTNICCADANKDGKIGGQDATKILQIYAGAPEIGNCSMTPKVSTAKLSQIASLIEALQKLIDSLK